ncbi:MAG: M14 family zinc carboxypeptidase [Candidatus Hodarchaeota archaeon]
MLLVGVVDEIGQIVTGDGITGEDAPGGVDPNRNYAYEFGNPMGASSNPNSLIYSENCTARLRDFVLQRNFISAVSLHSGIEAILGPWAWSSSPPSGIDGYIYDTLGKALEDQTGIPFIPLYWGMG